MFIWRDKAEISAVKGHGINSSRAAVQQRVRKDIPVVFQLEHAEDGICFRAGSKSPRLISHLYATWERRNGLSIGHINNDPITSAYWRIT